MSTLPRVDSTNDRGPATEGSAETSALTASIMNRTHWIQRVLSPWVQRWLSTGGPEEESTRSGVQHSFASLTSAETQRTLARMHVQYESHSNLDTPTVGGELPLAGAVERPAPAIDSEVVEKSIPSKPRRAQGPYSKPFDSMEDFVRAIEAAKERDYAPPPSEEQPRPKPKQEPGPYSKPFDSMEEFVRAVEAAKERDYAPPPPEEQPRPKPKREPGPYSKAFNSLEDFLKALEETKSQWGPVALEESSAETVEPSTPSEAQFTRSDRVRPISHVEELPTHVETRTVTGSNDLSAPASEISRPAPATRPATTQTQSRSALAITPPPAVAPAAAPASPHVQRSPLEPAADLSASEEEVEPEVQRSAMPTLRRMEAPPRSVQRQATEPVSAEPLDEETQAANPWASIDMPLVQRQAKIDAPEEEEEPEKQSAPVVQRQATANVSESKEEPDEKSAPVVQRQVKADVLEPEEELEEQPAPKVQRQAKAEVPEEEEEPKEQPAPKVQRQAASPSTPIDMPLAQRQAKARAPEEEEPEEKSAPVVQRQATADVSESEEEPQEKSAPVVQRQAAKSSVPQTTLQRSSATNVSLPDAHTVASSVDRAASHPAQLPLVQRQPAMPESSAEEPVAVQPASDSHAVPFQTEPQVAPRPLAMDRPLVQRQAVPSTEAVDDRETPIEQPAPSEEPEETVQRSATSIAPAPKPVVQRQVAETKAAPQHDAARAPQAAQPREKKIVAPLSDLQPPSAHIEMPLVQRQPAEMELDLPSSAAAESAAEEEAATGETLQRKWAPPTIKPAAPIVQRSAIESAASAETAGPLDEDEVAATPSAQQEMPLVQRQPLEGRPAAIPSQPTVVQRSLASEKPEAETAPQPALDLSERILSRVAPPERRAAVKPVELPLHHPTVQRESPPEATAPAQAVVSERSSMPFVSTSDALGAAPVIQRTAEPVIQRTAVEPDTSSSGVGFIQRVESVAPEAKAEASKSPDLNKLARQIYPLIKRLIAVERERRSFR